MSQAVNGSVEVRPSKWPLRRFLWAWGIFALFVVNLGFPGIRTASSLLNYTVAVAAMVLPVIVLRQAVRCSPGRLRVSNAILAVLALVSGWLFVGMPSCAGLACMTLNHGKDFCERASAVETKGGTLVAYRCNYEGAVGDFILAVNQEKTFLPGLKITRGLTGASRASDARFTVLDDAHVQVTIPLHSGGTHQEVLLVRRFVWF